MPILNREDSEELSPGVERYALVDGDKGSESTSVGDVLVGVDGVVPTHIHPTEEAMVILQGEMDAILGDDVITVTEGQTVLAPPGVRHGFVNRSGAPARVLAIFPTANMERTLVD
ncbi:MAG: cupin domain-containing protein [Chloroflexi bacterium]|nr:cupin domain-containing protein [Chloroflexota bacterium]MCY3638866.1 cupin domain-containing protein [Chloroflexota bacterium]MYC06481.1 cupin domain-containing protein [Chloroflexota bacterium]